jgi:hypothetical protein
VKETKGWYAWISKSHGSFFRPWSAITRLHYTTFQCSPLHHPTRPHAHATVLSRRLAFRPSSTSTQSRTIGNQIALYRGVFGVAAEDDARFFQGFRRLFRRRLGLAISYTCCVEPLCSASVFITTARRATTSKHILIASQPSSHSNPCDDAPAAIPCKPRFHHFLMETHPSRFTLPFRRPGFCAALRLPAAPPRVPCPSQGPG